MVVDSVEGCVFSLEVYHVFVEGDMMSNKVDGFLGCE